MDIDAILSKEHADLTATEWDELRSYLRGDNIPKLDLDAQVQRHADLEAQLAQSVSDWGKFSRVIADILRS